MGKDERIQKIIESWRGPQRLQEDTWQNVTLVLDYYGFTYERKKEWVCNHEKFSKLAENPRSKDLLKSVGLGSMGDFAVAIKISESSCRILILIDNFKFSGTLLSSQFITIADSTNSAVAGCLINTITATVGVKKFGR